MSGLRESVRLITPGGKLSGHLYVDADGLPKLDVATPKDNPVAFQGYYPWTFPSTWTLSSPTCGELYMAWREIEEIQARLRRAQREAGEEMPEPDDDITTYKRDAEARGER